MEFREGKASCLATEYTVARVVAVVHAWLHSYIYDTLYHSRRDVKDRDHECDRGNIFQNLENSGIKLRSTAVKVRLSHLVESRNALRSANYGPMGRDL